MMHFGNGDMENRPQKAPMSRYAMSTLWGVTVTVE